MTLAGADSQRMRGVACASGVKYAKSDKFMALCTAKQSKEANLKRFFEQKTRCVGFAEICGFSSEILSTDFADIKTLVFLSVASNPRLPSVLWFQRPLLFLVFSCVWLHR